MSQTSLPAGQAGLPAEKAGFERNETNEGEPHGLRLIREDALPEHIHYRDEGCELSPSCLHCPLPFCRYDHPGGLRHIRNRGRDSEIVRLRYRERLPISALARRFGVSRRTIFRVLKRANRKTAPPRTRPVSSVINRASRVTGAS
jgi:hypothetical protein